MPHVNLSLHVSLVITAHSKSLEVFVFLLSPSLSCGTVLGCRALGFVRS